MLLKVNFINYCGALFVRVIRLYRLSRDAGRIAGLFLLLAASAPARADFLDDLFGGGDSAPPPAASRPARKAQRGSFSVHPLAEHKSARTTKGHEEGDAGHGPYVAGSRPQKAALCGAADPATSERSTAYLRDETLRAGDSIVTDGAIVVFKGSRACPHRASDFVSVARADLPRSTRNTLAALEQSMRSPQRGFTIDAPRSKVADRMRAAP